MHSSKTVYSNACLQITSILSVLDVLFSFCEPDYYWGCCRHQDIDPEICALLVIGENDDAEECRRWSMALPGALGRGRRQPAWECLGKYTSLVGISRERLFSPTIAVVSSLGMPAKDEGIFQDAGAERWNLGTTPRRNSQRTTPGQRSTVPTHSHTTCPQSPTNPSNLSA